MHKRIRNFAIITIMGLIATGCNISAPNTSTGTPADSQRSTSGRVINLSRQGLTRLPAYVFNQTGTEELDVSHNSLTGAIQAEIRQLVNLKILNASYNSMTGVPAELGQLRNLEVLDLSHNQLTGLPQELGNLQNLKTLNLSGNNYSRQDLESIRSKLPPTVNIIVN